MKCFSTLVSFAALAATVAEASMARYPFQHRRMAKKSGGSEKFVAAHHMVGNTAPYTQQDWLTDIQAAHAAGIDAFALNFGPDAWERDQIANAYAAAQSSGTGFKLFFSFDMSVLPCAGPDDAGTLRDLIKQYAPHGSQLKYNGRSFVSSFAGESCQFGQGSAAQGWKSQFTEHPDLTGENAVHFVPSFFVDPSTFGQYSGAMHGAFNFNSGWPITLTTQSLGSNLISIIASTISSAVSQLVGSLAHYVGATDTDTQYINGLKNLNSDDGVKTYMGAVSPWFFTHYGEDSYNKNWIYYAGSHLYATRWENIIDNAGMFDAVEIVTWNDFGESHYIGPVHGAQPNSNAWVDGFNHAAWLDMTNYYATAFKSGSYPPITEDKIYLWARSHPKDANAPDPVGKPTNSELDSDLLWAVVFATAPGNVTLKTSDTNSQSFAVKTGVNKLSFQLTPGGYMHGILQRGGQTIIDIRPQNYTFDANPQNYNFNAFTAFAGAHGSPTSS